MTPGSTRDGNDSTVVVRPQGDAGSAARGMGALGVGVFIASLSVLFLAGFVAYVIILRRAESWPPPGAPPLPALLWLSTLLLAACSVAVQAALNGIRAAGQRRLRAGLVVALGLAAAFVATQGWAWYRFFHASTFRSHLYGFTFYMLTGLHSAHIAAGLVLLAVVTFRAFAGAYSWAYYPGVRHNAVYWHFLCLMWIVIYALLLAGPYLA